MTTQDREREGGEPTGAGLVSGPVVAEYRFRYTEAYIVESLKHYRRQHHLRRWFWLVKLVGYLGLLGLLAIAVMTKVYALSALTIFFTLLLALGPQLDYWLARQRFRKSPSHNSDAVVRLSLAGFFGQDPNSLTELRWSFFVKGHRFQDGFLLFTAPEHFYWLPNSALVSGAVEEVSGLLSAKLPKYDGGEGRGK